jgi:hypothetical protein
MLKRPPAAPTPPAPAAAALAVKAARLASGLEKGSAWVAVLPRGAVMGCRVAALAGVEL